MQSRLIPGILLLCTILVHAQQSQRCEWHLPQTTDSATHEWVDKYGNSQYFKSVFTYGEPIDLDSLNGLTFNVPANVTRIKRSALGFKDESEGQGGGADLIFMIDGSGSMWWGSENVAVITYEGDTLYRIQGGEQSGFPVGRIVKMVQGVPREFNLYCCSDRNDLYRVPGDPFYESWGMMKETILLQRDLVANAYSGFMPFAGQYKRDNDPASGNHDYYTPLANVSKGHPDAIANLMQLWHLGRNQYDGRTLPGPALPVAKARRAQWTAIQWGLDDAMEELQTMGQTSNRAVIVFSDGEVHDAAAEHLTEEKIASYPYPVYSISLIEPRYDSNFTMSRITEGTGGQHWTVRPGDQDSLARIMRSILGQVTKVKIPVEVELVNNSLTTPMTSYAADWGFEKTPDGKGWGVTFDSVLALAEGVNQLTYSVTLEDGETGQRETKTATFTVNVGGGAAPEGYTSCYDVARLSMQSQSGRTTRIHPEEDGNFTLTLRNSAFDLVGRMNPTYGYSLVLGDTLEMELDGTIEKDSSQYPYELFSSTYSYSGQATSADPADNTLQSLDEDTLVLRWEHPRDPRDTATLIIKTDDGSLIPPTANPDPGTFEQASLAVTLIDQNPDVDPEIMYSIDGGGYQRYLSPIQLTAAGAVDTFTIYAFATAPDRLNSDTVSFRYIFEVPELLPPTADPASGTYEGATLAVTLSEPNSGASATIHYSIDGAAFQPYSSPLQLDAGSTGQSHTVRAFAAATGYLNSDTVSFDYTQTLPTLQPPTANPGSGTYEGVTLAVTLSEPNGGASATIHYALDGSEFGRYATVLQLDAGATGQTHTIRAYIAATGYLRSDTVSFTYTQTLPELQPPTASPAPGSYEQDTLAVSLSDPNAGASATVYYSIDGAAFQPYASSLRLDAAGREQSYTVRAYIAASGYLSSDTASFAYTVTLPTLAPPTASPDGGAFKGSQTVTLSHPESGVTIRYTLDGSDPANSPTATVYAGPVTLDAPGTTTLKAIASKQGFLDSPLYTATFTNEDSEGPYVTKAVYFLGNLPGSGGEVKPDTLVVTFNEPVRCDEIGAGGPASYLRFVDDDGATGSAQVFTGVSPANPCNGTTKSLTLLLSKTGQISPIDDSLAAVAGILHDPYGNPTPAKSAVVIEWGRDYDIVAIARTVFSPGEQIPPVILGRLAPGGPVPPKTGTMVQIMSVKKLVAEKSYADVYDVVGNLVASRLPLRAEKGDESRYWLLWSGTNQFGRSVGIGTYLVVLTTETNDGTRSQKRIRLGVK
jgi:hypothetical protein